MQRSPSVAPTIDGLPCVRLSYPIDFSLALFLIGFLVAIGLFIAGLFAADWLHHHHSVQNILIVLMVLLPATGAALDGYGEKMGLENDVKRYQHIIGLFERAEQQLQKNLNDEQYKALLQELGQAALEENSEWVLFHRDHPVEVPKG